MALILITHTWNDELYLPHWLKHHKKLFDHGVIIYYDSQDSTLEIIKTLVPDWDIVKPTKKIFESVSCDEQIQYIESTFPSDWKCCLTCTEFIETDNLREKIALFEAEYPDKIGFFFSGWGLVDTPEQRHSELGKNMPLLLQKQHGFDMRIDSTNFSSRNFGKRFFHKALHGNYVAGRHRTNHDENTYIEIYDKLKLIRCFYTPFNEKGKARKLRMKDNISEHEKENGLCFQHFMSEQEMEEDYVRHLEISFDLLTSEEYRNDIDDIFGINK